MSDKYASTNKGNERNFDMVIPAGDRLQKPFGGMASEAAIKEVRIVTPPRTVSAASGSLPQSLPNTIPPPVYLPT